MALSVTTLTTVDQLQGLQEEWIGLLGRTRADLPFLRPEWLITWWELFRQDRSVIRDSLHVKAVRSESGELVALVPLMVTERPAVGPARVRTLGFLGADKYITEQRAPIVDGAYEADVAQALASNLASDGSWSWIAWEGLEPGSLFAKTLGQTMALQWQEQQSANILHLPPSWDEFRRGFKEHLKKSVRHCYNSLKREGMSAQLEVAATPQQIAPALEIFFKLHSSLAQEAEEVVRTDRFADPTARRFLALVCERLAARNITRVFTLRIGGAPVASRVAFQLPECLYLYHSGYDPAWRKYAVATTIVADAIKYAIHLGIPRVHLSMGVDESKARWNPETPRFHQAVWVKPQLSSRFALGLYSLARTDAMRRVRSLLGRSFG